MYGMRRTTVYLPDDLEAALERTAAVHGKSEAEVVRGALAAATADHAHPRPQIPLFESADPTLAERWLPWAGIPPASLIMRARWSSFTQAAQPRSATLRGMSRLDRRAVAGLHRTIPALPVRDVGAAVAYYRDRFGFEARHE